MRPLTYTLACCLALAIAAAVECRRMLREIAGVRWAG